MLFVWGINLGHQSGASIWGTNVHAAAEGDPSPETADAIRQRIDLADRPFPVISLVGMAVVPVLAFHF